MPMPEAFGMVGFFIIHPQAAWDPVVDRDFLLLFQNFMIRPNTTVPDSFSDTFNWHTINGRSGPYTTPMVVKHGERVRIRILDFSPIPHHPVHLHGHTFWVTAHEGARIPNKGLMTVVRVLPEDLYDLVMHSDEPLQPGAVFQEIVRRRGDNRTSRSSPQQTD